MITQDQFQKITNIKDVTKLTNVYNSLIETFNKFNINTTQRISHFLAQVMVESEDFSAVVENLNYSAHALLATFPSHFTAAEAQAYARQPEKIANRAYANRMGNGDEASGEGWKFRGRGYIQCTGKANYSGFGKELGIDLINHPELLEQPEYAMLCAGAYWNDRNLNVVADKSGDDVTKITKAINGGTNGLATRQANYNSIKTILS